MTPKLRFPGFEGAWQARHGRDAFTSRRSRGRPGLPLYSVTLDRGMVRRDSLEREFASNATDESNLRAERDDLVYNMMRMWQGAVGRAPEECIVSPAYVVLAAKAETSPQFFEYWFQRNRSIYWLWAYSHGLTSDRLRLYFRDFSQVPMSLPSREEQEKIADIFGAVDERIRLLRQRRAGLERYKRGVMQRLFTQTLRFQRDDGTAFPDWSNSTMGDVALVSMGQSPDSSSYNDHAVGVPLIQGNADIRNRRSAPRRFTSSPTKLCGPGDILLSVRAPVGEVSKATDVACIGRGLAALRSRNHNDQEFLFQYLLFYELRWISLGQGSTFTAISGPDIRKLVLQAPHPSEQRKIGNFLSALDHRIAAVSTKIETMQTFKKGLLQQMFV